MKTKKAICDCRSYGESLSCPRHGHPEPSPTQTHTPGTFPMGYLKSALRKDRMRQEYIDYAVRAVNSHADLLEALKELKSILSQNHEKFTNHAGFAYKMSRAEQAINRAEVR